MSRHQRVTVFCLLLVAMVSHVAVADWSIAPVRTAAPARTGAVQAYEVGTADALQARSVVGDRIAVHHVGQAHKQMYPGAFAK
jgi:hypothetical protein